MCANQGGINWPLHSRKPLDILPTKSNKIIMEGGGNDYPFLDVTHLSKAAIMIGGMIKMGAGRTILVITVSFTAYRKTVEKDG